MKRLLIPLLAALALPTTVEANWFGKYGSRSEARSACWNWQSGGFRFQWQNQIGKHDDSSRSCYYEEETKQYLGFEKQNVKRGKVHQGYPNKVVKRRFKF